MNIGHNSQFAEIDALPASLQDIADVLGHGVVIALVQNFAGLELRIPHKLKPDHKLMVMGQLYAQMICDFCPGDTIHVPMSLDRREMKRQVDALERQGFKRSEIAQKLQITQRHVRRLANKEEPDDRQMDMFSDL